MQKYISNLLENEMTPERQPRLVRGFSAEKGGSKPEVDAAIEAVKAQLEQKTSEKYSSISVVSYREQVFAGKIYFIKVSFVL